MTGQLPRVGVVVIGRDEGDRLRRCLESVRDSRYPEDRIEVTYVDSESRDGSAALACRYADRVLVVRMTRPSAALVRNVGWRSTACELVHFVDGDTRLRRDWLRTAVETLAREPAGVACVFGDLREERPDANLWHRMMAQDWERMSEGWRRDPSSVCYCGGNALFRRAALDRVGGFDPSLAGGEEPDLCVRLALEGRAVRYLPVPMGDHDIDMRTFRDYWRRGVKTGIAYARVSRRHRGAFPLWRTRLRRDLALALAVLPGGLGIGAAAGVAAGGLAGGVAGALAGPPLALGALVLRKAFRFWSAGEPAGRAFLGAAHTYLAKLGTWQGEMADLGRGEDPEGGEWSVLLSWENDRARAVPVVPDRMDAIEDSHVGNGHVRVEGLVR